MKKIILGLFICLIWLACANAQQMAMVLMDPASGAGNPSVPTGDSCTSGLLFSWHAENVDVTAGTPAGCSAGDTTATAVWSPTLCHTVAPKDGSEAVCLPGSWNNHSYSFSISSEDIVKSAAGTVDLWIYSGSTPGGGGGFWKANGGANDYRSLIWTGSPLQFSFYIMDGGTFRSTYSAISGGIQASTWYHIIAKWDHTVHGSDYISICADTTYGTTNCGTDTRALGTWGGTLATLYIGDTTSNGFSAAIEIDIIKVYSTWQ